MRSIPSGVLFLAFMTPGVAATVSVGFAGSVDVSTNPAFPAGSAVSGMFTYRTDLLIDNPGVSNRIFFLDTGALIVTAGGHTYSNTNANLSFHDDVHVATSGAFRINGNAMGGIGPLDGGKAFLAFDGSSDPAFAALQLPFPFPTDFTSARFVLNSILEVSGTITAYKAENKEDFVPEPATFTLVVIGVATLGLTRRWTRRC
jgi:hypothetical protein